MLSDGSLQFRQLLRVIVHHRNAENRTTKRMIREASSTSDQALTHGVALS